MYDTLRVFRQRAGDLSINEPDAVELRKDQRVQTQATTSVPKVLSAKAPAKAPAKAALESASERDSARVLKGATQPAARPVVAKASTEPARV